jgi:hypothetical protein
LIYKELIIIQWLKVEEQTLIYKALIKKQWLKVEEQTLIYKALIIIQWLKVEEQTLIYKVRVTRKIGDELKYSGRVSSSCSTCGTHGVALATNPMIIYE